MQGSRRSKGPKPDTSTPVASVTSARNVTPRGTSWVYPAVSGDAEFVRRVRAGDQAAYAVLVARYRARLGRYAVHMLGDHDDAEEALQDALDRKSTRLNSS